MNLSPPQPMAHGREGNSLPWVVESLEAIAQYDGQGRYRSASQAMLAILGLDAWPGQVSNSYLASEATEGSTQQALFRQAAKIVEAVLKTRRSQWAQHSLSGQGNIRTFEASYSLVELTPAGPGSYILSVWREVTTAQLPPPQIKANKPSIHIGQLTATGAEMPNMALVRPDPWQSVPPRWGAQSPTEDYNLANRATTESYSTIAAASLSSLELLRVVLDSIPQYIFWKDLDSTYLGCNRRWAEMAGLDHPGQVVGLSDRDLPWTDEERRWYLTCDQHVLTSNTAMVGIKQSQRQANGNITWRETSKFPLHDAQGNVIGLLGMIEDVTQHKMAVELLQESATKFRKLAQQEELINKISNQIRQSLQLQTILRTTVDTLQELFEADRVLICQLQPNQQGRVIVEALESPWPSMMATTEAESPCLDLLPALGQPHECRIFTDIHRAAWDDASLNRLRALKVKASISAPILVQDQVWGMLVAHQCRSVREWAPTEVELLQVLATQVGVAIRQAELYQDAQSNAKVAQRQAEQLQTALVELKAAQAQLVQQEKMSSLGQLVAGVAHELNNPANFIYGNIAYLQGYVEDLVKLLELYQHQYPQPEPPLKHHLKALDLDFVLEDLAKVLQSLQVGADRICHVVLSLRNFARLDEAQVKTVNIHEGIDSTLSMLQHLLEPMAKFPGIKVRRSYGELPLITCYPSQLNQVFMSILDNAIEALREQGSSAGEGTPQTPGCITITTSVVADHVVIQIHNTGPAIPGAIRKKLFDPFFTTKPVGQGTGLGLSISHQIIVERHHGRITCHSPATGGTEFRIEIPRSLPLPS